MFCMSKTGLYSRLQAGLCQWGYELKTWKLKRWKIYGQIYWFYCYQKKRILHFIFTRLKKANLYSKCLEMWNLILTSLASNYLPCTVAETALKSSMVSIQENLEWNLPRSPTKLWQPTIQGIHSEISFSCGYSRKYLWFCSAYVSLLSFPQLGCTMPSLLLKH